MASHHAEIKQRSVITPDDDVLHCILVKRYVKVLWAAAVVSHLCHLTDPTPLPASLKRDLGYRENNITNV